MRRIFVGDIQGCSDALQRLLASVGFAQLSVQYLLSPVLAGLAYWAIGRHAFLWATMEVYARLFTALMIVIGLTLLVAGLR